MLFYGCFKGNMGYVCLKEWTTTQCWSYTVHRIAWSTYICAKMYKTENIKRRTISHNAVYSIFHCHWKNIWLIIVIILFKNITAFTKWLPGYQSELASFCSKHTIINWTFFIFYFGRYLFWSCHINCIAIIFHNAICVEIFKQDINRPETGHTEEGLRGE